jgi:hypothetical protein
MSLTGSGLKSFRSIPTFGTVGALAEIIDNSIQWRRKDIQCDIGVYLIERGRSKNVKDIIIMDNGQGMGDIIDTCLYFGGGTNHGATSNLGKFGIGLPYSSCSQSEEYHVYSWQKKGEYKHVYRNHKEFGPNELVKDKPHNKLNELPTLFLEINPDLKKYESGTIIYWKDCDRINPKLAQTILRHLDEQLGRTYRHFIKKNHINIEWKTFHILSNKQSPIQDQNLSYPIKKNDPLRLMKSGTLLLNDPYLIPEGEHDIFQFFRDVIVTSKPDSNLNGHKHIIKLKASYAKKETQRNKNGFAQGREPIGQLCKRNWGISLIRSNREIKLSQFGYSFPNSDDPLNRWWKIEASFEPISDDILNVNANKTDALNFRHIDSEDYEQHNIDGGGVTNLEVDLKHNLSCEISRLFKDMMAEIKKVGEGKKKKSNPTHHKCPSCNKFMMKGGKCSACNHEISYCSAHNIELDENGNCEICDRIVVSKICTTCHSTLDENNECKNCKKKPTPPLTPEEESQLKRILKKYDIFNEDEEAIQNTIDWFVRSGKGHFVVFVPEDTNPHVFINYQTYQGKFEIIFVNTLHPFYKTHIKELWVNGDEELESIILFIISWVTAEKHYDNESSKKELISQFRMNFGLKLSENLSTWENLITSS